jgi:hypothetical protein
MLALAAHDEEVMASPLRMLTRLLEALPGDAGASAISTFTTPRAIIGAIKAAILERPDLLDTQEFEDELVSLAMHMDQPRLRTSLVRKLKENGTIGWARTTDLRIHNPAL